MTGYDAPGTNACLTDQPLYTQDGPGELRPKQAAAAQCTATGCDRKRRKRGYCEAHLYRFKTYGDPLAHIPFGANLGRSRGRVPSPPGTIKRHPNHYATILVPGHPLAKLSSGWAYLHRVVLFAVIGPGAHRCHWCGRTVTWDLRRGPSALQTDHLNGDRRDNHPSNLVPACGSCNGAWVGQAGLAHPNTMRWKCQKAMRDAVRLLILTRDPICTIQTHCSGAQSTTVDHIVPLMHGGEPFETSNCRGACLSCNAAQGSRIRKLTTASAASA